MLWLTVERNTVLLNRKAQKWEQPGPQCQSGKRENIALRVWWLSPFLLFIHFRAPEGSLTLQGGAESAVQRGQTDSPHRSDHRTSPRLFLRVHVGVRKGCCL